MFNHSKEYYIIKKCTKCKLEKPIEEFTTKTGNVTTKCKGCLREEQLEWRNRNKEKVNARKKELYQEDLENKRACARKASKRFRTESKENRKIITDRYKDKNREKLLEDARIYARKRYAENTEREKERARVWREKNPEKYRESCRKNSINKKKYYEANKETIIERARVWSKENPEKAKESREKYKKNIKKCNPEKFSEQHRKEAVVQRKKYPEKAKARLLLDYAVKTGFLTRPTTCSACYKEARIEGHHPDYDKPLEVVWLCKKCHMAEHKRLKNEDT